MREKIRLLLFLLSGFLFFMFFWHEGLGVNHLLFTLVVSTICFFVTKKADHNRLLYFAIFLLYSLAIAILLHGSLYTGIMFWLTLFVVTGFLIAQGSVQSNLYALRLSIVNLFLYPKGFQQSIQQTKLGDNNTTHLLKKYIRLITIPLLVVIVFLVLYRSANLVFYELTDTFFKALAEILADWFSGLSFASGLFAMLGFWLVGNLLFLGTDESETIVTEPDLDLNRAKLKQKKSNFLKGLNRGLESERNTAIITLILVNALALFVNGIDLKWVWMDYSGATANELSQFVHEGTYYLIFSILLSSAILLFFFRNNLNFMRGTSILRLLSYGWIAQNIFMIASVAIRNYYYITEYGLAHKRLGVIFFLFAVLMGLLSLAYKLHKRKTMWFFVQLNAWSMFLILVATSWVNWDIHIAKYNIEQAKNEIIDTSFLLSLSPKTIPYLETKKAEIQLRSNKFYSSRFEDLLARRKEKFKKRKNNQSWLSWSWSNSKVLDLDKDLQ